jgi:iron(III) transport system substrate-binding protein
MYKETIAEMEGPLHQAFPELKIHFFQAGSEEVAAKVNAETLAGGTKADLLMFSDRFWYEEMALRKKLHAFKNPGAALVDASQKNADGYYSAVCLPVMVMIYNSDAISAGEAPQSFKEMADLKWKNKFTTGSPLSSGTNFTTLAFLQKKYGWEYFRALRANDTIAEGGNSSVLRRVQTKERPVGWILLENVLRLKGKDPKIKVIYPSDGVVMQANMMAITQKSGSREIPEKIAQWMYSQAAQTAMVRSYMYSPLPGFAAPEGAPPLAELLKNAQSWSPEFLSEVTKERDEIKEEFTQIMFQ